MSGAVISSNVSLRVNAAVSNSITADGALHTPAANSYSIVQVSIKYTTGTVPRLVLGGQTILSMNNISSTWNGQVQQIGYYETSIITNIFVGPGQTLQILDGTSSGFRATVTGVNFINSP